jgi:integrase
MLGEDAFILPSGLKGGNMPQMPYVFTQGSLEDFFGFVDNMPRAYRSPIRHLVAPVMFRYMYCCGLRPSEARKLRQEDVDLHSGRIFIRESKHYREREIYACEDLIKLTEEYLHEICLIFPETEALFPGRNGGYMSYDAQQNLFERCRNQTGISGCGTKQPNLYSFRHSFATHRIYQWHKEGHDIGTVLPALSAYMGHTHYQHTLYYLHFLPELFMDLSGFDFEQFSNLLPEVMENE